LYFLKTRRKMGKNNSSPKTGKNSSRPLILVSNDDGYKAKGISSLTEIAKEFGDVVVVAASESQSAKSHSITIKDPIRYKKLEDTPELTRYVLKGTPADGVKLALCSILDRKPDLLLSGVNHGTNSSTSVVYSGTMAAALEGAIHRIPSIGFSLLDYRPDADFDAAIPFIRQIIRQTITSGLPEGICLNVNIPAVPREELRGIMVCRQTNGYWRESFEIREDPRGARYSWLTGTFINREPDATDTDEWALKNNYISVVPIQSDFTAHEHIDHLKSWEKKETYNESGH
jgi:5'-nucleotidase